MIPNPKAISALVFDLGNVLIEIDQILFLDDSPENVTGAAAAGLTAYQVCRDEDIPSLAAELLDGRADNINFSTTGEA